MPRFLPIILLLLPLIGCYKSGPIAISTLKPVAINEAAAYPAQETGTKPPMLTGFTPLTKQQLDEGWVQLFDGISTFGWKIAEGEGTLSVMTNGTKNFFVFDKNNPEKKAIIAHRSSGVTMGCESNGVISFGGKGGWATDFGHTSPSNTTRFVLSDGLRSKPNNVQPLTESDWKPVAGASEAKWSDGVLKLTSGVGMVETVKEYGDFILQLEYFTPVRIDEEGINSGVFFRCIPGEILNGYKCQIFNSPPDEYYARFIGADTGGILRQNVGRNVGPKDGEWNYLTIAARGADVAIWVNGIQVTDWTDTREEHENPRRGKRLQPGTIQLQGHDPEMTILFRNMRIVEM